MHSVCARPAVSIVIWCRRCGAESGIDPQATRLRSTREFRIAPVRRPMINEIGHFALVLALCIAALQAVVPLVGAARNDAALMGWARPAALAQFLFVAIAFFVLMHAYAVSDFSLANVAANSSSMKPLIYKLT